MNIEITDEKLALINSLIYSMEEDSDEAYGEIDNKYDDENILYASCLGAELSGFIRALQIIFDDEYDKLFIK